MLTFISNSDHYNEVLSRVMHVKQSLRIGMATSIMFLNLCS